MTRIIERRRAGLAGGRAAASPGVLAGHPARSLRWPVTSRHAS